MYTNKTRKKETEGIIVAVHKKLGKTDIKGEIEGNSNIYPKGKKGDGETGVRNSSDAK